MIAAFAIIDAVSRTYGLPYSAFRKPESKHGNLTGTRQQSDARLTAAYLLRTVGDVSIADTARLLGYKWNGRLGHRIRAQHTRFYETNENYRGRYGRAMALIAEAVSGSGRGHQKASHHSSPSARN